MFEEANDGSELKIAEIRLFAEHEVSEKVTDGIPNKMMETVGLTTAGTSTRLVNDQTGTAIVKLELSEVIVFRAVTIENI